MKQETLSKITAEVKRDLNGNQVNEQMFKYEPISFKKKFIWMQQAGIKTDVENPLPSFGILILLVIVAGLILFFSPIVHLIN